MKNRKKYQFCKRINIVTGFIAGICFAMAISLADTASFLPVLFFFAIGLPFTLAAYVSLKFSYYYKRKTRQQIRHSTGNIYAENAA